MVSYGRTVEVWNVNRSTLSAKRSLVQKSAVLGNQARNFYRDCTAGHAHMSTKEIPILNLNSAESFRGLVFDGVYTLGDRIRDDVGGTFFDAVSDEGERLLLKLAPDLGTESDERFAVWQRARHLRHANLLHLRDSGRVEIGGVSYVYAVLDHPDDVLGAAVEAQLLDEEAARNVISATLSALRYLHGQGLVHGAVDTEHIVAVGDSVKLTTDVLQETDRLEANAEDVRQLGELIRTLFAPDAPPRDLAFVAGHATEPDPRNRWTLAEIAASLQEARGNVRHIVSQPMASREGQAAATIPAPAAEPVPPVEGIPATVVAPVQTVPPLPSAGMRQPYEARTPGRFPRWIFAAVGILLLFILITNLRRSPEPRHATPPAAPVANPASSPARNEAARIVEPKPSPLQPVKASGTAMWRLIAFTYTSRDMAARKAKQINERWPELHASVFVPGDRQGYYLVALGGRMLREDAAKLQHQARGLGLPHDIYVQNYSE